MKLRLYFLKQLPKGLDLLPVLSSVYNLVLGSLGHCLVFLHAPAQFSGSWCLHLHVHFTVVPTESCPVGSSNTIIVNERNREHDKQEAWLLIELQKLRRQIEASEIQMVQRAPLGVDQGAMHDFSVRIKDLEVTVDVWASQVQYDSVLRSVYDHLEKTSISCRKFSAGS